MVIAVPINKRGTRGEVRLPSAGMIIGGVLPEQRILEGTRSAWSVRAKEGRDKRLSLTTSSRTEAIPH